MQPLTQEKELKKLINQRCDVFKALQRVRPEYTDEVATDKQSVVVWAETTVLRLVREIGEAVSRNSSGVSMVPSR